MIYLWDFIFSESTQSAHIQLIRSNHSRRRYFFCIFDLNIRFMDPKSIINLIKTDFSLYLNVSFAAADCNHKSNV